MAIRRCLAFITEGDGDPGLVREELRELETRKRTLERSQAQREKEHAVEVHPNFPELYRKNVTELQSLLSDEETRQRAMEMIRSMIERIDIREGAQRGIPKVILVGSLANILTFAQNQTAASCSGDGGRVLMVAGAGFVEARTNCKIQKAV